MTHRRAILILLAVYWAILFTVTHIPVNRLPGPGGVNDKLAHFGGYFILAALLYLAFWICRPGMRGAWWMVILVGMVYGAADELLQIPVGRTCEFADWVADVAGTITAVAWLAGLRRMIEHRTRRLEPAPAIP
jgi:VanZ family protein